MIKILYIRDCNGKNFGTVAYDISGRSSGTIAYSLATCNSKDSFSKDTGIKIATSRLESNPITIRVRSNSLNVDIVRAILTRISRTEDVPTGIRKLSRKSLKNYRSIC